MRNLWRNSSAPLDKETGEVVVAEEWTSQPHDLYFAFSRYALYPKRVFMTVWRTASRRYLHIRGEVTRLLRSGPLSDKEEIWPRQ